MQCYDLLSTEPGGYIHPQPGKFSQLRMMFIVFLRLTCASLQNVFFFWIQNTNVVEPIVVSSLTFLITPVPYPTNFSLWCVPSKQRMLSHQHGFLHVVVMTKCIALQGVLRDLFPVGCSTVGQSRSFQLPELL